MDTTADDPGNMQDSRKHGENSGWVPGGWIRCSASWKRPRFSRDPCHWGDSGPF
jgi:hypothetical protein